MFVGGDAPDAATDAAAAAAAAHSGSTTNVHPLLSSFINYTHPIKFQGKTLETFSLGLIYNISLNFCLVPYLVYELLQ